MSLHDDAFEPYVLARCREAVEVERVRRDREVREAIEKRRERSRKAAENGIAAEYILMHEGVVSAMDEILQELGLVGEAKR